MKKRIHTLISAMSEHMYEREQIIALSLLAGVAGLNTFLYGPPGTAKSLISRRVSSAFEFTEYFEYLMNRFSTPEEIFGPVSIKALKEDQYIRKTEHYLPRAEFAFLDEIWKASPAILNTLLTLVNEHSFKNGDMIQHVPLKVLMSASNEIPESDQGLDALYDRFILRLVAPPIQQVNHFHALLQAKPVMAKPEVDSALKIKKHELDEWRIQIYAVQLPDAVLAVFDEIKQRLALNLDELDIYVSDRRWQRVAYLVKAAAFLDQRSQVALNDLFILQHCLWTQPEEIELIAQIVEESILEFGLKYASALDELIVEKEQLEQDILNAFYYTDDVYESYLIADTEYLRVTMNLDEHYKDRTLYLALDKMGTNKDFFAVDVTGEEVRGIVCNYNGGRRCTLKGGYYGLEEVVTPYIKYPKGSLRNVVDDAQVVQLKAQIKQLKVKLQQDAVQQAQAFAHEQQALQSIFVLPAQAEKLAQGMQAREALYQIQQQDCVRLEQLCQR